MALETDRVELTLGDKTIAITESYEVRASVFRQPAGFSIQIGHSGITADLLRRFPPNTPFKLTVNGNRFQTGYIDTVLTDDSSGGTSVTLQGRDIMSRLVDAYIPYEQSYQESTYTDLVRSQLKAVGLGDVKITASNAANRAAITGSKVIETKPAEIEADVIESVDVRNVIPGTKKVVYATLKAKLGTRRYDFLKTQLDRAGLFLWAAGDGSVVVARPTPEQSLLAELVRRWSPPEARSPLLPGTILRHSYRNSIARRFTNCIVYGYGGGRNFGRSKNKGVYVDQEMLKLVGDGVQYARPLVIHDDDATTVEKAQNLALRKIMEANRDAWELSYVVAGHSVPGSKGSVIWAPDTVVAVEDPELGISGVFYVEEVTMSRNPATTTTLKLMKPEHVKFGVDS